MTFRKGKRPPGRARKWELSRRDMKASFQTHLARFRLNYPELTFTQALERFALQFGISPRTAWRWKPDIPKPPKPVSKWRRVTSEERQQIHALAGRGWSARKIGRHLGIDHHTVRRQLIKPADYIVKHPCRPRGARRRFVALQYGQRLPPRIESRMLPALAPTEVPQELEALTTRLQAASDGSRPLSGQEAVDFQARTERLQRACGYVPESSPAPPRPWHQSAQRSAPPVSTNDELTIRMPR